MLDIDHFKNFNDIYGHEAGDIVLRELGALLQKQIRSEDIACRFGGEEFILILPEANQDVTVKRADHIREAVKAMRVEYQHQSLGMISVSLGVAIYPIHSSTSEGILKKADEALYQAKHNGRDRVEVALV
jgi:diguanylate cyclase (GGDEF)-like protein